MLVDNREQSSSELFDLLAHLVDPPLFPFEVGHRPPQQQVEIRFKQLPWLVEFALIEWLHNQDSTFFETAPRDRFETAPYADANEDLTNAAAYYTGRSYLLDYKVSCSFVERTNKLRGLNQGVFGSDTIESWMKEGGLYEAAPDNPDPHFAERAFLINVLIPAFGLQVLQCLTADKRLPGYPYVVDFLLRTTDGDVVIEVDGREYHDPVRIGPDRFEQELKRQNLIQSLGYPIFRYAARRILQEPEAVIDEVRRNIPALSADTGMLFQESLQASDSDPIAIAEGICEWFRPVQLALLLSLKRSTGQETFKILDRNAPPGLTELCVRDLSRLTYQTQSLYGCSVEWPQTILVATNATPDFVLRYDTACTQGPDQSNGVEAFGVRIEHNSGLQSSTDYDLIIDLAQEGRIPLVPEGSRPDLIGRESRILSVLAARMEALCLPRPSERNSLRPANLRKQLLDCFARRFLRIPALYHRFDSERPKKQERQYELIRRILSSSNTFGIMPTGRGKSIGFQLPARLIPGGALVISPLRALMRDQIEDLRLTRGWNCVESIRYDQRADEKSEAIGNFIRGGIKLLYVSPERLQELKFSTRLAQAAATAHVSFIAIDEAHCVSEWGHDFRLAYMQIPNFLAKLRENQAGVGCPILALTATASPPVRRDVCSILELHPEDARKGGDLIAEANIDRTELSLSVHQVVGDDYPNDRQDTLRSTLLKVLPSALKHNHPSFSWERFTTGEWLGKGAGAIFCVYANPHGQTSWHDGVGAVRDYLCNEHVIDAKEVNVYAADSPDMCPDCQREGFVHYTIRNVPRSEQEDEEVKQLECSNGHKFERASSYEDWPIRVAETQYRFKKNEFPLLVTTKAYGMGIDHRGLRFVVHYGLPSSIESYYQEIGRAGRDGNHAHCALLVRQPANKCWDKYFVRTQTEADYENADDETILPPCLFGRSRTLRRCPEEIGLPEPCDLSRQLIMILDTYQKPESFAPACADLWERLTKREVESDGRLYYVVRGGSAMAEKTFQRTQNFLYRLQQLGLIGHYMLEYLPRGSKGKTFFDVRFHIVPCPTRNVGDLRKSLVERLIEVRSVHTNEAGSGCEKVRAVENEVRELLTSRSDARLTREFVQIAVGKLFAAVRGHVIKMRMESFVKLLRYVRSDEGCRRKELLGGMTEEVHGNDAYSCGFCNSRTCVPTVHFQKQLAKAAPDGLQYKDFFAKVDETFVTQELGDVAETVQEAVERGVIDGLRHQATTHVEADPDNLAANLLAAEAFAAKGRTDMHRYYRNFARVANVQQRMTEEARIGYQRYKAHDAVEAIRSYAIADSVFDSKEGLVQLAFDAQNIPLERSERDNLTVAVRAACESRLAETARNTLDALDELLR